MNNSNKRNLYLITGSYPYSFSAEDNFLEFEIQHLAQNFKLVIVPLRMDGTFNESLSEHYTIDSSLAELIINFQSSRFRKILMLCKLEFILEALGSGSKIFSPNYFWRAVSHWIQILCARTWIETLSKEDLEGSIFYSWWFLPETIGLASSSVVPQPSVITRAHGFDLYEDRDLPEGKPFRKKYIDRLTAIYPVSNFGNEYMSARYPKVSNKIRTAYLGVPDFGLNPSRINPNHVNLVSCSIIDPVKRIDLMLRGIIRFANDLPDQVVQWTHFGTGHLDLDMETTLAECVPPNLSVRILEYPGIQNLRKFYKETPIDAFINTSKSEGIPVSMMEAASFGIPLIGPEVGGVPEIIVHDVNGFLMSNIPDEEEVAIGIATVVSDHDKNRSYRQNSYDLWAKDFDSSKNYATFVKYLIE